MSSIPADLQYTAEHEWLTTGDPAAFQQIGRRFLGPELSAAERFAWVAA